MQRLQQKENSVLQEIRSFSYPRLITGKEWYVLFYAFDPARNSMRRKRIKLNHIEKIGERRKWSS
ncbi:MAG: hypothetical protein E6772_14165 [Dysgonomonas sp.]|nr:hypothetical protein [Dysgonomonas sp.]